MLRTQLRVVGVTFKNEDKTSRQEILGNLYDDIWLEGREDEIEVRLKREPANKHDANAIAVFIDRPQGYEGQVGYISRENNEVLAPQMDDGLFRVATIADMGCMRGGRVWMAIDVEVSTGNDSPEEDKTIEDEDGNVYEFD